MDLGEGSFKSSKLGAVSQRKCGRNVSLVGILRGICVVGLLRLHSMPFSQRFLMPISVSSVFLGQILNIAVYLYSSI